MINERVRPNIVGPTEKGNFYCIDGEYLTHHIMWMPVKNSEGTEFFLPVEVPAGASAPRVQTQLLFPCIHVIQPSAFNDAEFSISHVLLRVNLNIFETTRRNSDGFKILHTSCLLPQSREAKPDESYLAPMICYQKTRTIGRMERPYIQTAAVEDVRLFSPEIEKFYTETLPTWKLPQPMSWNELRDGILIGKLSFNFPFIVPDAILYIESDLVPEEFLHFVREETRKGILR